MRYSSRLALPFLFSGSDCDATSLRIRGLAIIHLLGECVSEWIPFENHEEKIYRLVALLIRDFLG